MRSGSRGFSFLELMLVLAVVGILIMMTLPSLREGAIRKQVKEGMALADLAQKGVAAHYAASGEMPNNNEQAGIPPANKIVGNFVKAVDVTEGAVTLTFGNNANSAIEGKKLTLRPAIVPEHRAVPIAWVCANVAVPKSMEAKGRDATDIPINWLPVECRSAEAGKK
jgi:type IV pilus assembly protein PilA